jgi:LysM domain
MSAMPADALTCGSDVRPGPDGAEVIPLRAGLAVAPPLAVAPRHPVTAPRHPAAAPCHPATAPRHPATAARRVAPGGTPRDTPGVPLRLTRRGRVVVAVVAALLVTVISLLATGAAQATNHGPSSGAARHGLVQVVVRPGQSLWSVAEKAAPDRDTRAVIQQIIDLNSLNGDTVSAGQHLWVPRG